MNCASCGYEGATYTVLGDARVFCNKACYWTRQEEARRREWFQILNNGATPFGTRGGPPRLYIPCEACGSRNTESVHTRKVKALGGARVRSCICHSCGHRYAVPVDRVVVNAEWRRKRATA